MIVSQTTSFAHHVRPERSLLKPSEVCRHDSGRVLTASTIWSSEAQAGVHESLKCDDGPISIDELRRAYARRDFKCIRLLGEKSTLAELLDAYVAFTTLIEAAQQFERLVSTS